MMPIASIQEWIRMVKIGCSCMPYPLPNRRCTTADPDRRYAIRACPAFELGYRLQKSQPTYSGQSSSRVLSEPVRKKKALQVLTLKLKMLQMAQM